jgi:hypothetical protein
VGTVLFPQIGTEVWANVEVPQTGKAVSGFCPRAVQTCANKALFANNINPIKSVAIFFKFISIRQRYFLQAFSCIPLIDKLTGSYFLSPVA